MAFLVTENWSGRVFSKRPPWSAVREFTVTSNTPVDAGQVPTAPGLPRTNDQYEDVPVLLCEGSSITRTLGPLAWVVRSPYSVSPRGRHFEQYASLLDQPRRVQWWNARCSEEVERDVDGNPLINSARDPFTGSPRNFIYKNLRIWRYEPFYNFAHAALFENTVNADTLNLDGLTVLPGQMMCNCILPVDEYDTAALVLRIGYDFELRLGADGNYQHADPFQWRFLDQGQRGWWQNGEVRQVGQIFGALGQVTTDVRLNGKGKPVDAVFTIEGNPPIELDVPAGATIDGDTAGTVATFLRYKRYRSTNFNDIGIL